MCTIIDPGFTSTVQDQGRTGYRAFGMPVAGAMDRYAFAMANILAGNGRDADAAVEMTLRGARFRFSHPGYVSVCGADMQGELNGDRISNWSGFPVAANDELAFGYAVSGCRSYVAFHGGIDVPKVMGSRSTYLRAHIGGYQGRALQAGDVLRFADASARPTEKVELSSLLLPSYTIAVRLRAMPGPQDDLFTEEAIRTFFDSEYTISARNDRMGYVLQGPALTHKNGADIISDALCPGAVQVPGDGRPIILAADCQTTGGYAKIATVIGSDLPKLAQLKTGDKVGFIKCSDAEAVAALIAERQCYEKACRDRNAIH